MKLIGLTGGIGSGKSTVAQIFRILRIPIYESDVHARLIMNTDKEVRLQIKSLLGDQAYTESGEANRTWIASRVFNESALLAKLNAIIHPAVRQDVSKWIQQHDLQEAPYGLKESAILFEENLDSELDAMILVVAPEGIRIQRVIDRDQISTEQVRDRMKYQWPDEKKIPMSDFIIYNDGERPLLEQVLDIDQMIRKVT